MTIRYRFERVVALTAAVLAVVTGVWPAWLEGAFGVDPDRGSGAAEWSLVGGLVLLAAACGVAALSDRRRLRAGAPTAS